MTEAKMITTENVAEVLYQKQIEMFTAKGIGLSDLCEILDGANDVHCGLISEGKETRSWQDVMIERHGADWATKEYKPLDLFKLAEDYHKLELKMGKPND